VVSAADLMALRTAGLAALAARELVARGAVTAAVLGTGPPARWHLTTLARCVPAISHITVCSTGCGSGPLAGPGIQDWLELSGIGLTTAASVADALFGATLIVVTGEEASQLRSSHLVRGAVLVNAADRPMPADVLAGVDQIYVDDADLLPEHTHRGLTLSDRPRRPAHLDGRRTVSATLRQVLASEHRGRDPFDDIVLVELLGAGRLDDLACAVADRLATTGPAATLSRRPVNALPSR
jgi:ornithine cyclodeaminase/alanine dehydrogenase-like protein (mu-crystallin family)